MRYMIVAFLLNPLGARVAVEPPLPVFVLVGQSNMTGADSAISPAIPGKETGDANVLFWNRSAYQGHVWENDSAFHPLRVQNSRPYGGDIIGPEYGFAREMRSVSGMKRMAIVKVSFPSTSMVGDWRKTSSVTGFAYTALHEELTQAMKALVDAGETPHVQGILVHQGISDAMQGEAMALAYAENLRAFIANVRAEFGETDTPVVLARENMSPLANPEHMRIVRESTVRVAENTPHTAWINVDGLERVRGHHFTAASQMEIGRRYAVGFRSLL